MMNSDNILYDNITHTLFIRLFDTHFTDEDEIAPGVHILWEYSNGQRTDRIAAIEVENFAK